MGFVGEFLIFLKKYQVIGLAVAFIIGAASTKLVTALVNDIVMPVISVLIPGGDWRASILEIGPVKFMIGDFVGALIDFIIIAFVVFVIVKLLMKEDAMQRR
ncbi:MAG: MscL family protein [Candidatus Micrarchaeota archaeon]